ncbi:bifunctional folylpolyglutamate synthase/dihydrofolate synthase [Evansella sp. AB-P1]|uniref:bifunctional folylpolyglutamate synthase/dihydrofolate synthase n=1 Tax=Evansella sp. AB-P1 TaxID=3037653 RepID=UPI00241CFA5C|nr:folylpolyglutamate synthase/dihydrofolate synthase family protein [Evansella sp. AB-P1]MDG5786870.1 bifunctional folylpolyglutamate synthase/dihydrofolate synthase [Evansella sp. AB-P1]
MIATYIEAKDYIISRKQAGIRYDLTRMKLLIEKLGHPERRVKTIHVAGTNGKGSTVTYLRSMLEEAGFFVGTFMTPVFGEEREQIGINNNPMSEEEFIEVIAEIKNAVEETEREVGESISEFELMTAVALYYFSFKKPVDIAVIEAGMGGRLDATNVITPLVSIITNVGMDHQAFLGNTLEEISREKSGIIKQGVPVMTACEGAALQVLKEEAKKKKSTLYSLKEQVKVQTWIENDVQMMTYESTFGELKEIPLGMVGSFQGKNAALSVMVVNYLKQFYALLVEDDKILRGLEKGKLPGRLEEINNNPVIVLDTAHNQEAIDETMNTIVTLYKNKEINVLFASMKDKAAEEMLRSIEKTAHKMYVTSFSSPRSRTIEDYKQLSSKFDKLETVDDSSSWLKDWIKENKNTSKILLITGSHQFVGEIRTELTLI